MLFSDELLFFCCHVVPYLTGSFHFIIRQERRTFQFIKKPLFVKNKERGKKANNEVRQSPPCQESLTCYLECYQLEETCIIENQSLTAHSVKAHTHMYVHTHKRPSRLTHTNLQTRSSLAKAIIFSVGEVHSCSGLGVAVRVLVQEYSFGKSSCTRLPASQTVSSAPQESLLP